MTDLNDEVFIERRIEKQVRPRYPLDRIDIILLKMDKKVYFQTSISPICLMEEHIKLNGNAQFLYVYDI